MGSTIAGLVLGMVYLPRTWMLLVAKSCLTALSFRKTVPPMQLVCNVLTTTALNETDQSFLKKVSCISPIAGSLVIPSANRESWELGLMGKL